MSTRRTSWELLEQIAEAELPASSKNILNASMRFINLDTLKMYPSVGKLAKGAGLHSRTVERHLSNVLIPRGILVPESPRTGGRRRGTGAGITTVYRLDLDALAATSKTNPDAVPGYGKNPGNQDTKPRQDAASTPAECQENPGRVPHEPPGNHQQNHQPTTTGDGGGVCAPSGGRERPDGFDENVSLLRQFGATSRAKIEAAARAHPPDLVRELLKHGRANDLGPGLVLQMLQSQQELPERVVRAVEDRRLTSARAAEEMERQRAQIESLPPDQATSLRELAGIAEGDQSESATRSIVAALERQELHKWREALSKEQQLELRRLFQAYSINRLWEDAESDPRYRSHLLREIQAIANRGQRSCQTATNFVEYGDERVAGRTQEGHRDE